jgi:hypothetical protein
MSAGAGLAAWERPDPAYAWMVDVCPHDLPCRQPIGAVTR